MNENIIASTNTTTIFYKIKRYTYLIIKRIFDILISLIGLIFLLPVALIVKISYMITGDFKSIFFVQDRIGKNGKIFKFFKFRTMVPNADEILNQTLKLDPKLMEEYTMNKKLKEDPRITKAGKIIRRYSIDELPQLINIFIGDMSLIGNRPYLPREKKDMGESFNTIVSTKPGLTGWWQVSGRSDVTFKKRLELESYYSNHSSFKIDIKVFFKTFSAVIGHKGAK